MEDAASYDVYFSTDGQSWSKLKTTSGSGLKHGSARTGTAYSYYAVAVSGDGTTSGKSNIVSCSARLARPEVTLSNIPSSGKIRIKWKAVSGAVGYAVYRATSRDGEYTLLKTTKGTSLNNISNTTAGNAYYYKVMALAEDENANSAFSTMKYRTCDLPQPEVTLSNIESSGKIRISWEKIDGANKYRVYRSADGENWSLLKTTTGTGLNNISNTTAGTTYFYKVVAVCANSAGNSAESEVESRTCTLAQPDASVKLNSKGKPVVTWDKISGASRYRVHILDSAGKLLKTVSASGTKLTHSTAKSDANYQYRVMAIHADSAANSALSDSVSIKSR